MAYQADPRCDGPSPKKDVLRSYREGERREEVRGYVFLVLAISLVVAGGVLLPMDRATGLLRFDKGGLPTGAVPATAASATWVSMVFYLFRKSSLCWAEERRLRKERLRLEICPWYLLASPEGVRLVLSYVENGPGPVGSPQKSESQLPLFGPIPEPQS